VQKNIKINDVSVTDLTPPVGYTVKRRSVTGGNTVTMQNGQSYRDIIAWKSDVEVPFMPLTDAQLKTLMTNIKSDLTCALYFFDPDLGKYRTMTAYPTIDKRKFRGKGVNNSYYWTGVTLTFEEM
jgi:hypothetical protein